MGAVEAIREQPQLLSPPHEASTPGLRWAHHLARRTRFARERYELEAPREKARGDGTGDDRTRRRTLEDGHQCAPCVAERRGVKLDVIAGAGEGQRCGMKGGGRG